MYIFFPGILLDLANLTYLSRSSDFGMAILGIKVERLKPGVVLPVGLTGYFRPSQYSRSSQYWSIGG